MRTQDAISAEISKLRQLRNEVPAQVDFCDDSQAAIDAEIIVLQERLGIGDILDRSELDTSHPDYFSEDQRDMALDARAWLDGGDMQQPSLCWAHYVF
jgi:hypothetical protein